MFIKIFTKVNNFLPFVKKKMIKRRYETCDVPINFVGLKMYTHMTENEHESTKQKILIRVLLRLN